jgi:hypothetical protein
MYAMTEYNSAEMNVVEEYIPQHEYEDEDAFSEPDYDSDVCEANLNDFDDEESEDEIWEDEEDKDEEVSNELRLMLLREKNKKQLEGLSVLDDKLNWLEKIPFVEESDINNEEYPRLGEIVKPRRSPQRSPKRSPKHSPQFKPATCIKIKVGNKTYIEFEPIICKFVKDGKVCTFGEYCNYSHELPKPKSKPSGKPRLCNFIKNGEECKFKERCKFSHDIVTPKNNVKDVIVEKQKPMCRNGLNCENRKCTFIHPAGHKKTEKNGRVHHKSPIQIINKRTPHSSSSSPKFFLEQTDKKFLLCKNMFQIESPKKIMNKNGEPKFIEGNIKKINSCKFGVNCMFAHDWTEVRDKLNRTVTDFKCFYEKNCKNVETMTIKKIVDGKERSTRRYLNTGDRKCSKIHEKEAIKHFIMRTQCRT